MLVPCNVVAAAGGAGYAVLVGQDGQERGYERGGFGELQNNASPVLTTGALINDFTMNIVSSSLVVTLDVGFLPDSPASFTVMEIFNGPMADTYTRAAANYNDTLPGSTRWTWGAQVGDFVVGEIYRFEFR